MGLKRDFKMNFLEFLAQNEITQSKESWLFGAIFLMIIFNIIWKPIERKLFPNDSLKELIEISSQNNKMITELYSWHNDKDIRTGQHRWKIPPDLISISEKQINLLNKISENQISLTHEIKRLTTSIDTLLNKTETMGKSLDRFIIKMQG